MLIVQNGWKGPEGSRESVARAITDSVADIGPRADLRCYISKKTGAIFTVALSVTFDPSSPVHESVKVVLVESRLVAAPVSPAEAVDHVSPLVPEMLHEATLSYSQYRVVADPLRTRLGRASNSWTVTKAGGAIHVPLLQPAGQCSIVPPEQLSTTQSPEHTLRGEHEFEGASHVSVTVLDVSDVPEVSDEELFDGAGGFEAAAFAANDSTETPLAQAT